MPLTACSSADDELHRFIEDTKNEPGGRVEPLPEIKPYETFVYAASDMRSPFVPSSPRAGAGPRGVRPDVLRKQFGIVPDGLGGYIERPGGDSKHKQHRSSLEQRSPCKFLDPYSLDMLKKVGTLRLGGTKYVGTLRLGGAMYWLVETEDGLVHRVAMPNDKPLPTVQCLRPVSEGLRPAPGAAPATGPT